jgi:hypothetical protein
MLVPVFKLGFYPRGTNVIISFPTQSGFNYQAEYKTNLTDLQWIPIGNNVPGNNLIESVTNSTAAQTCFYRMQIH